MRCVAARRIAVPALCRAFAEARTPAHMNWLASDACFLLSCANVIVVVESNGETSSLTLPASLGPISGPPCVHSRREVLVALSNGSVILADLVTLKWRILCELASPLLTALRFNDCLLVSTSSTVAPPCLVSSLKRVDVGLRHLPLSAICKDCYATGSSLYDFSNQIIVQLDERVQHLVALSAPRVLCALESGRLCVVDVAARLTLCSVDGLGPIAEMHENSEENDGVLLITMDGLVHVIDDACCLPLSMARVALPTRARTATWQGRGVCVLSEHGVLHHCVAIGAAADVDQVLLRLSYYAQEQAQLDSRIRAVDTRIALAVKALNIKWGNAEAADRVEVYEEARGRGRWGAPSLLPAQKYSLAVLPLAGGLAVASAPRLERQDILSLLSPLSSLALPSEPCALVLRVEGLSRMLARLDVKTASEVLSKVATAWRQSGATSPSRAVVSNGQFRITLEFDHLDHATINISAPNIPGAALLREALQARLGPGAGDDITCAQVAEESNKGKRRRRDDVHRALLEARDALCAGDGEQAVRKAVAAWKLIG